MMKIDLLVFPKSCQQSKETKRFEKNAFKVSRLLALEILTAYSWNAVQTKYAIKSRLFLKIVHQNAPLMQRG